MEDITSFNQLFASAKRNNLHLNGFYQHQDGKFACNWRTITETKRFGPIVTAALPFEAARDAYLAALPLVNGNTKTAESETVDDLFS